MLNLIYGIGASTKSEHIYSLAADNAASASRSMVIVPEQEAVAAERRLCDIAPSGAMLNLDVLNFDKLCETVFRSCGSIAADYVTDTQKKLLISRAVADLSPSLKEFSGGHDDEAYISTMLRQLTEFKYASVSPTMLARAAKMLSNSDVSFEKRLSARLDELSLIFTAYNTLISDISFDPCDRLTTASELIRKYAPFKNTKFYFDSFNGFTAQEYELIRSLLATDADVYVSLCHPGVRTVDEVFAFTDDTRTRLLKCAELENADVSHFTVNGTRLKSRALKHIADTFTTVGQVNVCPDNSGDVSIISCADVFDECEICAAKIAADLRDGLRYRDITIIVRDPDKYKGLIDTALERYGIPCFFSPKTDITEKSLIRHIFTSLTLSRKSPRYSDVISYIKCGLTGLDDHELDTLESYVDMWKVSGKIWFSDDGFTMNPRGYLPFTEDDVKKLESINDLRMRITSPLSDLGQKIKEAKRVDDYSRAVYDMLISQNVLEKLSSRSVRMMNRGESVLAKEEEALWGAFCSALDELSITLGNDPCTPDEYEKLLKIALSDSELGVIPQSSDSVTIGDASLIRPDSARHVFMLGCEEASFPRACSVQGLLSLEERRLLAENDISELIYDPVLEASKELFYFYFAACSASERLTLTYSCFSETGEEQFPSSALLRIDAAFGGIIKGSDELDECEKIIDADSFTEHLPYLKKTVDEKTLLDFIYARDSLKASYERTSYPLCKRDERLGADAVKAVFPGDLKLSQTATDAYVKCPFSFQCKYSLRLSESGHDTIGKSDIGTLVHAVLTDLLKDGTDAYIKDGELMRDELRRRVTDVTKARARFLIDYTADNKRARVERMIERIADITSFCAVNLCEELFQSGFRPTFFEFPIGMGQSGILPLKLELDDGSRILLGGIADRVDTMVKNGKLYIRVADYKTGNRTFSLEDIRAGLSLQLLIYLFSIVENADAAFKIAANAPIDCEVIPAAAEYVMTSPDKPSPTLSEEEFYESVARGFKRSGIYLADGDILNELDRSEKSKYAPLTKLVGDSSTQVLADIERMNSIKDELSGILIVIGCGIKSGNAEIKPIADTASTAKKPCEYCKMKPVCKNAAAIGSFDDEEQL